MYQIYKNIVEKLGNTGERPVLETKIEEISNDISFAYKIASKYIKDKTVLDFGCGGGYGTEYLSRFTNKKIIGFDKNKKTIRITNNYFHSKNLNFSSKLPNEKFDVIVSFQVVEHIKDRKKYYKLLNKLLKPNGKILFSTPNKNLTSYGLKKPVMVFHEIEFDPKSLKKELSKNFKKIKIFGQINNEIKKRVKKNNYNYLDIVNSYPLRTKLTWWLSQIEIVRIISRHLPMSFKYLLMGYDKTRHKTEYSLTSNNQLVENSFCLIAIARNNKLK